MKMKVAIINKETGEVVGIYDIVEGGLNYTPTKKDYYSRAWKIAVADGDVDADERDKYTFSIQQET
ncbi:MAG: hypothetical protein O7G86_08930 [Gammaproteobacteria bacterium]|nr:hypothetical protein [Gammaproteobacteria bacterium]